ncbi:hypothetical protein RB595_003449 [Gaeumannomyces hyphopodioides]
MSSTYNYVPLSSPRHTRVLFLEPSLDFAAPLCCRISETSLDNLPESGIASYNALSYSWDAESPSSEVLCDGSALLVTPNCEAAMRRMRGDSKPIELWIDSICINQSAEAVEERNGQVALMGEIYKSARMVAIWLGEDDTKFKLLVERLRPILHWTHPFYHPDDIRKQWDIEAMMESTVKHLELMEKDIHSSVDDPFAALFERSWFSRMWVVQEVALSSGQRNVVLCGSCAIPWMSICYVSSAMGSISTPIWRRWIRAMLLQRALTDYIPNAGAGSSRDAKHDAISGDMTFILGSAREKQSGDPKDKVFALFGVFQELGMPLPAPDYKKPLAAIYREATAACIAHDKHLRVLYHVPSRQRREDLPSWVPDWSISGYNNSGLEENEPIPEMYWDPSAGGTGPSQWRFSSHPSPSLFVRGKIVDSISELGKLLVGDDEAIHGIKYRTAAGQEDWERLNRLFGHASAVFQDWLELAQRSSYTTEELPNMEVFKLGLVRLASRVCIAFRGWIKRGHQSSRQTTEITDATQQPDNPAREATREALRQTLFKQWPQTLTEQAPRDIYNHWCDNLSRSLGSPATGARPGLFDCHFMAVMSNMHTRFFLTQSGLMGTACELGPATLELGDKLVVIDGLEVPFLLRPLPRGGYKLVTHAYVHGIMHGESCGEGAQESERDPACVNSWDAE